MHLSPEAQTAHPVQPVPAHCPYLAAEHAEVAVAEAALLVLLLLLLLLAGFEVVETVEVESVVLRLEVVAVLEAAVGEDDEEELLPDEPRQIGQSVSQPASPARGTNQTRRHTQCKRRKKSYSPPGPETPTLTPPPST